MENAHLRRYPHPSSLRRTSMCASFLGISEALHLHIFHQPPNKSIPLAGRSANIRIGMLSFRRKPESSGNQ